MACLITTLGAREGEQLGIILPHEHVFVDLRRWNEPGYAQAETPDVIAQVGPEIKKAQKPASAPSSNAARSAWGGGADILCAVSKATDFLCWRRPAFTVNPGCPPGLTQPARPSCETGWLPS